MDTHRAGRGVTGREGDYRAQGGHTQGGKGAQGGHTGREGGTGWAHTGREGGHRAGGGL